MAYDNAGLVRRFYDEVWSNGKLEVIDELVATSCVSHDPLAGDLRGTEPLKTQVQQYRSAYPDLRFTIDDVVVAGDKVVTRWTATGTHKGPIMGVPPTNKSQAVSGISFTRIANGKFVEDWTQWDTVKFLRSIGLMGDATKGTPTETREARPH